MVSGTVVPGTVLVLDGLLGRAATLGADPGEAMARWAVREDSDHGVTLGGLDPHLVLHLDGDLSRDVLAAV